jgi:hypothetical protein
VSLRTRYGRVSRWFATTRETHKVVPYRVRKLTFPPSILADARLVSPLKGGLPLGVTLPWSCEATPKERPWRSLLHRSSLALPSSPKGGSTRAGSRFLLGLGQLFDAGDDGLHVCSLFGVA